MPNVVPGTTLRSTALPLLHRSYGQKFAWRAHREQLQSKEQPTVTSADGTKTLRLRPNKSGDQSTLPLPPVMDPIAVAAKQKYRGQKVWEPKEWEDMTTFEKALAVNPFAQALATPVRSCTVTRARLPSYFLQPYIGHFRVEGRHVKAYVGPSSTRSDKAIETESEGNAATFERSKSYVLNSQNVVRAIGRKKRNQQSVVTKRMQDSYEARVRALSAQTGASPKRADDWIWLGSEEKSKSMLLNDVVEAFEVYAKEDASFGDLVSMSRMEHGPFAIVLHPLAPRPWSLPSTEEFDGEGISQEEAYNDVVIPSYGLSSLGLTAKLEKLQVPPEVLKMPMVGILQNRRTLKLHLALRRLALFLGDEKFCRWIVVKAEDWSRLELHEHHVYPHILSSGMEGGG